MPIKLIATDMDGTFLRKTHTYDKKLFRKVLKRLEEENIKLLIASGGMYGRISNVFDKSVREDLYFLCDNGGYTAHGSKLLYTTSFSYDEHVAIVEKLKEIPGLNFYISTGAQSYGSNKQPFLRRKLEGFVFHLIGDKRIYLDSYKQIPKDEKVTKIAVRMPATGENMSVIKDALESLGIKMQILTSGTQAIDIIPYNSGKGNGLRYFQEKFNITKAETMAFGDAMNDRSMMQEAKYTFAMGNADPNLLNYCKYQIGTSDEQAMQNLLYELLGDEKGLSMNVLDKNLIK